jgi:hypothetical protein
MGIRGKGNTVSSGKSASTSNKVIAWIISGALVATVPMASIAPNVVLPQQKAYAGDAVQGSFSQAQQNAA